MLMFEWFYNNKAAVVAIANCSAIIGIFYMPERSSLHFDCRINEPYTSGRLYKTTKTKPRLCKMQL